MLGEGVGFQADVTGTAVSEPEMGGDAGCEAECLPLAAPGPCPSPTQHLLPSGAVLLRSVAFISPCIYTLHRPYNLCNLPPMRISSPACQPPPSALDISFPS